MPRATSGSVTAAEPGTTGTSASCAARRASALSPIVEISSALGPTKTSPASVTARENEGRSDRNPYPGCTRSHPVDLAASSSLSLFR